MKPILPLLLLALSMNLSAQKNMQRMDGDTLLVFKKATSAILFHYSFYSGHEMEMNDKEIKRLFGAFGLEDYYFNNGHEAYVDFGGHPGGTLEFETNHPFFHMKKPWHDLALRFGIGLIPRVSYVQAVNRSTITRTDSLYSFETNELEMFVDSAEFETNSWKYDYLQAGVQTSLIYRPGFAYIGAGAKVSKSFNTKFELNNTREIGYMYIRTDGDTITSDVTNTFVTTEIINAQSGIATSYFAIFGLMIEIQPGMLKSSSVTFGFDIQPQWNTLYIPEYEPVSGFNLDVNFIIGYRW